MSDFSRYCVFGYDHYYPQGGWEDFLGRFETIPEAVAFIKKHNFYEKYQIIDVVDGREIPHEED